MKCLYLYTDWWQLFARLIFLFAVVAIDYWIPNNDNTSKCTNLKVSFQLYYHVGLMKYLFKTFAFITLCDLVLKCGYNSGKLFYIIFSYDVCHF